MQQKLLSPIRSTQQSSLIWSINTSVRSAKA